MTSGKELLISNLGSLDASSRNLVGKENLFLVSFTDNSELLKEACRGSSASFIHSFIQ